MATARRASLGLSLVALAVSACQASASPAVSPSPSVSLESAEPSAPSAEPSQAATGWRELTVAGGPGPRSDHTWTVDPGAEVAYLFGGQPAAGSGALADLWAYSLVNDTWTQLAGGPPARFGHNAEWVPGVGLVIFAGQDGATFRNDLWAYDLDAGTWSELTAGGAVPVPRYGSCAALGPEGRLWISHGFTSDSGRFADTRAYDFTTSTWTDETPVGDAPVERCLHGCWWAGDAFNLYAGQTTGTTALGDWWALTVGPRPGTNSWAEVPIGGDGLPPRNLYALTAFRGGHLVFGGQTLDGSYLDDGWLIDHEGAPADVPPTSPRPTARAGAELVTDLERGRVLLFGGRDASGPQADVWELAVP
ncbi:MAG TPA: kelch repeat-containing protein [Nocardioides sp.]|nr:kelch repeat-containing protein [Nocardioides sp.]